MENYIIPQIIKYQNVDDLLKNDNKAHSLFGTEENLSTERLIQENFVCIVGEPGIGKSRLVEEIKKLKEKRLYFRTASMFERNSVPEGIEYCIIDALDEVEGDIFLRTLQSIKEYKEKNQKVKVLFTCRKHYVASYAKHFASCSSLTFIELCRLSDNDVMKIIKECSEITTANVIKNSKLKELLTIPRYLTFLLEYKEKRDDASSIRDFFEYIIVLKFCY